MTGQATHVTKLIRTSYSMKTVALKQILAEAMAILKDETSPV